MALLLKGAVVVYLGWGWGILIATVAPCSSVLDAAGSQRGFPGFALLSPVSLRAHAVSPAKETFQKGKRKSYRGSNLIFSCFFFKSHELVLYAGSV